jgi:hypothetical protein
MKMKIYQNQILCLYIYLMYFQYGGCKWLLTFHIQHNYKMKEKIYIYIIVHYRYP